MSDKQKIIELEERLRKHNEHYHKYDDPKISDQEYDMMKAQLRDLYFCLIPPKRKTI